MQEHTENASETITNNIERKAFVLLSGGLDSTVCLHKAIVDYSGDTYEDTLKRIDVNNTTPWYDPIPWVEAYSINYNQRHLKEADYAAKTCKRFGIKHSTLYLGGHLGGTMLTDPEQEIPNVSYSDLPHGVSPTYVPFRNGTMLSVITAQAQRWITHMTHAQELYLANRPKSARRERVSYEAGIYFGAHSEDAQNWAYPDCTPEFIGAMANAIYVGTYFQIRLHTPLMWLKKHEIVTLGDALKVDFSDTWSCYRGEETHCGVCPTCRSRKEAFVKAGVPDPTTYGDSGDTAPASLTLLY